ncbi:MAG: chromate transporter [Sulfobacillus thermotolerans]|nr:chromate transporter [Sulfobacillus thermotolerans]
MAPTATPTLKQLIQVYMKIGLLGFGGGFAVLAFIRSEVVDRNRWITPDQFDHMVEMSAFAPGPTTTNVLAAIAYRLMGWRGLIVGTCSVLWPSFLLILVLAKLTAVFNDPWITGALRGMEIAVVGLLVDVIWTLWQDVPHSSLTVAVAVVAGSLTWLGLNPVMIVVSAAAFAFVQFWWKSRTQS